jgi:hypothetical protein
MNGGTGDYYHYPVTGLVQLRVGGLAANLDGVNKHLTLHPATEE